MDIDPDITEEMFEALFKIAESHGLKTPIDVYAHAKACVSIMETTLGVKFARVTEKGVGPDGRPEN